MVWTWGWGGVVLEGEILSLFAEKLLFVNFLLTATQLNVLL
jgi:hypothetical protein